MTNLPTIKALLSAVAAGGDIFTDADDCRYSVQGAKNLQVLAGMLSTEPTIVAKGTVVSGNIRLPAVIHVDGRVHLVDTALSLNKVPTSPWVFKTETGEDLPVDGYVTDDEEICFIVVDAKAFYALLLR